MTTFYLGTHMPSWLTRVEFPLFVMHRRLVGRRTLPRAIGPWALDSGGFSELQMFGEWRTTPAEYVAAVRRYRDEIGNLAWAAPQDWMCEPVVIAGGRVGPVTFAGTRLSIAEHQRRTIENYLTLRSMAPDLPFIPVLQGWELSDYLRHVEAYDRVGVDLLVEPTVGIGSVCRRQHTAEIGHITSALSTLGLRLHGFGVKTLGLASYSMYLTSADSLGWSYRGRRVRPCAHGRAASEANCLPFARQWRERVLEVCEAAA